jgi:hypothetical protein
MLTLDVPSGRGRHESLWTRFCRFIEASNQVKADEAIRRHCHLLPHEMEAAGLRSNSRTEKSLSFRTERF